MDLRVIKGRTIVVVDALHMENSTSCDILIIKETWILLQLQLNVLGGRVAKAVLFVLKTHLSDLGRVI